MRWSFFLKNSLQFIAYVWYDLRTSFFNKYIYIHIWKLQVGFTKDGKITAVECDIYNNAGHSLDLSAAVSIFIFDYQI